MVNGRMTNNANNMSLLDHEDKLFDHSRSVAVHNAWIHLLSFLEEHCGCYAQYFNWDTKCYDSAPAYALASPYLDNYGQPANIYGIYRYIRLNTGVSRSVQFTELGVFFDDINFYIYPTNPDYPILLENFEGTKLPDNIKFINLNPHYPIVSYQDKNGIMKEFPYMDDVRLCIKNCPNLILDEIPNITIFNFDEYSSKL